ncbi:MAG: chemotaxis-specific protein-glutamate methyltransferase CheB [Alphaproteobacteria bacterium]|nr:chemotaxis-specific protein-glutamate methyltransferase CheB [Alphaproteobacteria bacterium]
MGNGVSHKDGSIKVMVVDDSAVARGMISRALNVDDTIEVVEACFNGARAIEAIDRLPDLDVIVLDNEMPEMNGITAIPKILEKRPDVKIIIASALALHDAEVTLTAMERGAVDYVTKPGVTGGLASTGDFAIELVEKVKAWGIQKRKATGKPLRQQEGKKSLFPNQDQKIVLRPPPRVFKPEVIAIGVSTGGPQALFDLFEQLKGKKLGVPIMITQHMPQNFTTILAEHIGRISDKPVFEGRDGMKVLPDNVYIAPGGFHMGIEADYEKSLYKIRLLDTPPENFCKPAADVMFRSLLPVYKGNILVVIMTGMGHDGLSESIRISDSGGYVIAQDEASSVVWGMPGAVATKGIANAIKPLSELGDAIYQLCDKNR